MTHEQQTDEEPARRLLWLDENAHEQAMQYVLEREAVLRVRGQTPGAQDLVAAYREALTSYDLGHRPEVVFPDALKREIAGIEGRAVSLAHALCAQVSDKQWLRRWAEIDEGGAKYVLPFWTFSVAIKTDVCRVTDLNKVAVALESHVADYLWGERDRRQYTPLNQRLYWRVAPHAEWCRNPGIPDFSEPFTGWKMRTRLAALDLDKMEPLPAPIDQSETLL